MRTEKSCRECGRKIPETFHELVQYCSPACVDKHGNKSNPQPTKNKTPEYDDDDNSGIYTTDENGIGKFNFKVDDLNGWDQLLTFLGFTDEEREDAVRKIAKIFDQNKNRKDFWE